MDLAQTDDGEFVFFEVNEAGQWLWQELHCPDCALLEPFSLYLASADDAFEWDESTRRWEFSAPEICSRLETDPRLQATNIAGFPDEGVHVSDERTTLASA